MFFTLISPRDPPPATANFKATSLITVLYTIIFTKEFCGSNVNLPMSLVLHPAQGEPSTVAVNLPTVADVLIPVALGLATFSKPSVPGPLSKFTNVQVAP